MQADAWRPRPLQPHPAQVGARAAGIAQPRQLQVRLDQGRPFQVHGRGLPLLRGRGPPLRCGQARAQPRQGQAGRVVAAQVDAAQVRAAQVRAAQVESFPQPLTRVTPGDRPLHATTRMRRQ